VNSSAPSIPPTCTKTAGPARAHPTSFSCFLAQTNDPLSSVKFGTLSQTPAQVLVNLETALPAIIAAVRGGWDNVQSLSIKSTKSTSLPIWSCKLGTGEGARWRGSALEDDESEDENEDVVLDVDVPQRKTSKAKQSLDRGGKLAAV